MDMGMVALYILLALLSQGNGQQTPFNVVVAQNGSGNFTTIGEAIAAAPNYSSEKYYIQVKEGFYFESIVVGIEKTNIVLIGEGMRRTIISGNKSAGGGFDTVSTSTVGIFGNGFMAQGITFENSAGPRMNQSVALLAKADNLTFYKCRFSGSQDTLYTAEGKQFFRDCIVIGTIDFILGDAAVLFQNCVILARKPLHGQYLIITAQQRLTGEENTGTILQNCTIKATRNLLKEESKFKCYLGRPWGRYSRVVVLQSFIDSVITPTGWVPWPGEPTNDVFYAEYDNRGPGANRALRVPWSTAITNVAQASQFTLRSFLQGGDWIPSSVPRYLDLIQDSTSVLR
ncbi:pectinesterase-like [Coffea arabica]|uniref:pectinesterase n=1 Tax=Coffea arabica TaxID=13443 RepID=A0A6P6WY09_COFAR|nr:pectinesterase-like [Coffea arabica]